MPIIVDICNDLTLFATTKKNFQQKYNIIFAGLCKQKLNMDFEEVLKMNEEDKYDLEQRLNQEEVFIFCPCIHKTKGNFKNYIKNEFKFY